MIGLPSVMSLQGASVNGAGFGCSAAEYVEYQTSTVPTALPANVHPPHPTPAQNTSRTQTSPGYEEPIVWAASSTGTGYSISWLAISRRYFPLSAPRWSGKPHVRRCNAHGHRPEDPSPVALTGG